MKKNNAENYEAIEIRVTKDKFPILYGSKRQDYLDNGMSEDEADAAMAECYIELELYYEKGQGVFAVEADAVECQPIYSPYTKEQLEENEE